MLRSALITACLFSATVCFAADATPKFKPQTIDDTVEIGYGTAIGDVNGDGKPDILLADKKEFVWYQNPTWQRHVIAENLTERDNVCIAARDIDGDGKVEIAVGGQWNPGDTLNSGAVFYLDPPADRSQLWEPIPLPNQPVIHRMRWVKLGDNKFALVVSPLHGKGNKKGEGAGVKLIAYEKPANPQDTWKQTVIEDTMHVTHNLDPAQWLPDTPAEEILYAGREGAMLLTYENGKWSTQKFPLIEGSGEIRMGQLSADSPFIATIEPLHGDRLVLYQTAPGQKKISKRQILDDNIKAGHAIATADLFGDGQQEIVAGWRTPNKDQKVGVKVYWATDASGKHWKSAWIDDNGMACEDIRLGDLNGDGKIDIVAAGRNSHNLKIYWNESK
ncbi:FG-GAP repeat domain-containing protein [Gimesia panareensis]|uniref:FG-GAP repeat domain-containing protein n=1 Tax=Gimesia panareensis TaxID=2527978 RepID=UPI00118958B6|nr:FG-GAP-like repeat-containing protein [Gimesia panareensis]QDU49781.1 FG-GAP repeat protein [Gimesia panareensis]